MGSNWGLDWDDVTYAAGYHVLLYTCMCCHLQTSMCGHGIPLGITGPSGEDWVRIGVRIGYKVAYAARNSYDN